MTKEGKSLYFKRKTKVKTFFPFLLIFLITLLLTFSITFLFSMTKSIERMVKVIGSGSLKTSEEVTLPENVKGSVDRVKSGGGILYSKNGEKVVTLKGVEREYFNKERIETLKLKGEDLSSRNGLVISKKIGDELGLKIKDKVTLLLYEEDKNRARPILMTINGIFTSGYSDLDDALSFLDISTLSTKESYEILLESERDEKSVKEYLDKLGIRSYSYKEVYPDIYLNIVQSTSSVYIILIFVALLAAFFSKDSASIILSKDLEDISTLLILGEEKKKIEKMYRDFILFFVFIAVVSGVILGILLSLFSPLIVRLSSLLNESIFDYYTTSFILTIPNVQILILVLVTIFMAYLSLRVYLSRVFKKEILLIKREE